MNKRTTEQWLSLFAEHDQSGLSAAVFCKEHQLCPKYFSLRRKQLSGQAKTANHSSPIHFIQAKPPKVDNASSAIRLRYGQVELFFEQADIASITAITKALA